MTDHVLLYYHSSGVELWMAGYHVKWITCTSIPKNRSFGGCLRGGPN